MHYTVGELKAALEGLENNLPIRITTDIAEGEAFDITDVQYESRGPEIFILFKKLQREGDDAEDIVIKCPHCGEEV